MSHHQQKGEARENPWTHKRNARRKNLEGILTLYTPILLFNALTLISITLTRALAILTISTNTAHNARMRSGDASRSCGLGSRRTRRRWRKWLALTGAAGADEEGDEVERRVNGYAVLLVQGCVCRHESSASGFSSPAYPSSSVPPACAATEADEPSVVEVEGTILDEESWKTQSEPRSGPYWPADGTRPVKRFVDYHNPKSFCPKEVHDALFENDADEYLERNESDSRRNTNNTNPAPSFSSSADLLHKLTPSARTP
ncbi:hypothetical protein CPC08DRAFT_769073 [Agrocybe pediades]|nr:hypothetical protein CPC08DRAFT_769073 [Agrocybe pediades]